MSRTVRGRGDPRDRFPRVSGDEPGTGVASMNFLAFSPRERG